MDNFLKVNLQLFAEDDNQDGFVDHQEDYDSQDFDVEDGEEVEQEEVEDDASEQEDDVEVADLQSPKQTPEENAVYKKMRLKAEDEARKKIESEMAEEKERINAMKVSMEMKVSENRILSEYLNPQKIYDYADQEGISEELAEKMLKYEAEKLISAEKTKVSENFNRLQTVKNELRGSSKYFSMVESEVDSIIANNPDLDYVTAYNHTVGAKINQLEKELSSKVEKRTIANIHDRARRKSVGGSDGGSDETVSPSSYLDKASMDMSIAFGNDPREVAKYVKNNLKKKGR